MNSRFSLKYLLAPLAASALLAGGPSAWASPLPIAPATGTFTAEGSLAPAWPGMAEGMATLFSGLDFSATGLSASVASVSVAGEGPGPVRIAFDPRIAGRVDTDQWSLIASDLAFDVGTKSLTMDVIVRVYNTCSEGGDVCPAWFSMDRDFQDLAVLKASDVRGTIDGVMPVDQAVVLQTLVPQQIDMSADLYVDLAAFNDLLPLIIPGFEPLPEDGTLRAALGTLTVTSVPEISTSGMMAMGIAGLALLAGRRRRR